MILVNTYFSVLGYVNKYFFGVAIYISSQVDIMKQMIHSQQIDEIVNKPDHYFRLTEISHINIQELWRMEKIIRNLHIHTTRWLRKQ